MRARVLAPAAVLLIGVFSVAAFAGVPRLINYQGILRNAVGESVADSTYEVTFRIYDQSSIERWSETHDVSTVEGLFSVELGSNGSPLGEQLLDYDECWLGITVGSDPEMSPRTRLVSVPYASRIGTIDGASGGTIDSDLGVTISGSVSHTDFNTDVWGDSAVVLPHNSVNADEMCNEAGITSESSSNLVALNPSAMTDVEAIAISIPDSGYVFVTGQCIVRTSGATTFDYIYVQIDEGYAGVHVAPYYARVGMATFPSANAHYYSVTVQRVYHKGAGYHSFRLEAMNANAAHTAEAQLGTITAMYFPTSYEPIRSAETENSAFGDAAPVDMVGSAISPE